MAEPIDINQVPPAGFQAPPADFQVPPIHLPTQEVPPLNFHAPPAVPAQPQPLILRLSKYLNKPDEYDGKDRYKCTTFLAQVRLYISGSPAEFPTEESKVLFTSTYLRGRAFSWVEPKMVKDDPILHDFSLFCLEMLRNLGDPDREKTMSKKLRSLKQTTSTASYRTEFDNIAQYLEWDDSALKQYFYEGLKESVKDSLALTDQDPDNLKDFQDLCTRLDNRLFERKQESKGSRPHLPSAQKDKDHKFPLKYRVTPSRPTVQVHNYGTPMDLDANSSNKKFKPLTPQERQHRMQNNLCLYCGKDGHRANVCPAKRKPARFSATLVGPMDKSAVKPTTSQSEN